MSKSRMITLLLILFATLACNQGAEQKKQPMGSRSLSAPKMSLTIKLRDGFNDDTVSIFLNGTEVYRKTHVQTDYTISFADSALIEVDTTTVSLEVKVEGGLSGSATIQVAETPYVDVWIIEGKMDIRASKEEVPMF